MTTEKDIVGRLTGLGKWEVQRHPATATELAMEAAAEITALRTALERAWGVLDWLAENEPGCYGWNAPFPSTTSGVKVEAEAARQALRRSDDA